MYYFYMMARTDVRWVWLDSLELLSNLEVSTISDEDVASTVRVIITGLGMF